MRGFPALAILYLIDGRADVAIAERDGTRWLAVVEVKQSLSDRAAAESQLRHYMRAMSCPIGLLVTPERLWLYRDTFRANGDAIELVGEYSVEGLFGRGSLKGEMELEGAVQEWLESFGRRVSATGCRDPFGMRSRSTFCRPCTSVR